MERRAFLIGALAGAATLPGLAAAGAPGESLARLKAIAAGVPMRQWANIPGTALRSVLPPMSMVPNGGLTNGPRAILESWNGCAYDPAKEDLYFWGGGHSDYGGNEVYKLSLEELRPVRLTDPSPLPPPSASQKCPVPADGTPSSAHVYDGIAWCPLTDSFWLWPTIGYCASGAGEVYTIGQCWQFHPATRKWSREPDLAAPAGAQAGFFAACWVPSHRKFLIHSVGRTRWFDPLSKSYGPWSGYAGWITEGTTTYVAHRDEVWMWLYGGMFKATLGTSAPSVPEPVIAIADMPPGIVKDAGFAYDEANRMIILWGGGREIWALDPDTLAWRHLPNAAGPAPSGTYAVLSKWKSVAALGCCVGYTNLDEGLWIYKPGELKQVAVWKLPPPSFIVENADGSSRRAFRSFQEAATALRDGQTLRIRPNPEGAWRAGAVISANGCTLKGDPGCKIQAELVDGGKACIVVKGADTTIEGLEIFGAVGDGSANAVRLEGKNLTLRNCNFHHNQMALESGGDNGTILAEDCTFSDSVGGASYAHNIYISATASGAASAFVMRRCRSLRANGLGHLVKSRALRTTIEDCVIAMMEGNASRCLDISDGGVVVIRNNVIEQGAASDNTEMIAIAPELARNTSSIEPLVTVALRDANRGWVRDTDKASAGNVVYRPDPVRVHSTLIENNLCISDCTAYPNRSGPMSMVRSASPAPVTLRGNRLVSALPKAVIAAPAPGGKIDDDGTNKVVIGRAAAGLDAYPSLPAPRAQGGQR